MYKLLEGKIEWSLKEIELGDPTLYNSFTNVVKSYLHKIATWPKIIPYIDMTLWIVNHVKIPTCSLCIVEGTIVGYFSPNDLQVMY